MNIYEIAKKCDVSVATVSRVLNGKSDVSAETRANILAVIDQYNFRPQITKSLHNAVCIFVANIGRDSYDIASPYVSRIINGMGSELFDAGYILSVVPLWQSLMDAERFKLYCRQHRIAGAVVVNLYDGHKFMDIAVEDFPIVFFGSKSRFPWIKSVSSENYSGAYDAVNYLIRMGHKRILHVGGNFTMFDHRSRRDGYIKALESNGITIDPNMILEHHTLKNTDYRLQITEIMRDPQTRPTAIFVCDDFDVIRLRSILDDIGISIPDDVSIVGFDDYDFSRFLSPPLTTVNQPVTEMGVSCGKLILELINKRNMDDIRDVIHKTQLVIRKSVKVLE